MLPGCQALQKQVGQLIGEGQVDQEGLKLVITKAVRQPMVKAMHEAGMSQSEIAAKTGVNQTTVSRDLANASASPPPPETYADALAAPEPVQIDLEEFTSSAGRVEPVSRSRSPLPDAAARRRQPRRHDGPRGVILRFVVQLEKIRRGRKAEQ
jgi:transcriptional regulator with XRE-family HTH domain